MGLFDSIGKAIQKKREKPLIMIVDDEMMLRELWSDFLTEMGCDTILVDDGRLTLELIKKHQPQLVLLDIQMPYMNGIEVLRVIKQTSDTRNTPVVMITGEQKGRDVETAFSLGAAGYIIKPPDKARFEAKMKEILAKCGYSFA